MPDTISPDLPVWSLQDLYEGFDAKDMTADQEFVRKDAEDLAKQWKSRLHDASAKDLADIISRYEVICEKLGRMTSFTDLAFAADMSEAETGRQAGVMREIESEISAQLVFVELELATLDDDLMAQHLADPALAYWEPWIRIVRAFKPHQLSEDMETMLLERQPAGRSAWIRLFDETAASLKFPIDGAMVGEAEILDALDATADLEQDEALHLHVQLNPVNDNSRLTDMSV